MFDKHLHNNNRPHLGQLYLNKPVNDLENAKLSDYANIKLAINLAESF